ncbi:MAG: HPr family phosphocarrier protein [Nitrospinota bacterium]|nr:HPr family phosphocarrier protein [Nitrospinota bacterium]
MPERNVIVTNELGVHARAAAAFAQLSTRFECEIFVSCRGMEVDGKSIMGVMMLTAPVGAELTIRADGKDAQDAVEQLAALVDNSFEE